MDYPVILYRVEMIKGERVEMPVGPWNCQNKVPRNMGDHISSIWHRKRKQARIPFACQVICMCTSNNVYTCSMNYVVGT